MMNRLSTVGDRIARRLSGLVVRDAGPQQKPPLRLASRRLLRQEQATVPSQGEHWDTGPFDLARRALSGSMRAAQELTMDSGYARRIGIHEPRREC